MTLGPGKLAAALDLASWPIPKDADLIPSLSVLKALTIEKSKFNNDKISKLRAEKTFSSRAAFKN